MANTVPIESEYLHSGDMIDIDYQIVGSNETMIALAVHSIKQSVAADPRLDYQSGRREKRVDLSTGINYEYLVVRVIVRRYPRGEPEPEIQTAGIWVPIIAIVALASAAVISYSTAIIYRSYSIVRVSESSAPESVKAAAIGQLSTMPGFDFLANVPQWIIMAAIVGGIYIALKRKD